MTSSSTTGGDANEFAHGRGDKQFMNLAFSFNPTLASLAPYSILGMGLVFLPTKNSLLTFSVIDTEGTTTKSGFDTLFKDGTTLSGEGRFTIKPFGFTGHQLIGFGWGNKNFNSLDQDPRTLLGNILFGSLLEKEKSSWAIYDNFDQYLYSPANDPSQGIGIFGRFGISDGKANALHQFYSFGVGGKGMIPGREKDQWGIG
jgi:porin